MLGYQGEQMFKQFEEKAKEFSDPKKGKMHKGKRNHMKHKKH